MDRRNRHRWERKTHTCRRSERERGRERRMIRHVSSTNDTDLCLDIDQQTNIFWACVRRPAWPSHIQSSALQSRSFDSTLSFRSDAMLQMTLAGHYYSLRCLLFCYLFLRITALNETDHQTNETIIEFNSTLINPISLTSDSYEVNATVIVPTDNVTDSSTIADVSTVFTILNSTVSFTSPVYNATDTTLLDITTVVSSSQSESIENNTTPVYTSVFTTESSNRQSTDVANTSCEASKYGCCADGITVRDGNVPSQ